MLVDDHEVVRVGLKALLEKHPSFEVVAEAVGRQPRLLERVRDADLDRQPPATLEDPQDIARLRHFPT